MGFWEQLLDYFTRIDDILRKHSQDYLEGNQKLITKITELIKAITGVEPGEPEPDVPRRHVPFVAESTVDGGETVTLLITADSEQGLGSVGRSGYFINDSDEYVHLLIDDGKGKSKKIRIDGSERFVIDRSDDIWIDKLTIDATDARAQVAYRCLFSR